MQALRETDPRRIGPYAVLGRLGAGGMGEVYLAESGTGLRLAVKVVRAEHAEDRTFRARFRQEVRAAQTVGGAGTYTARVVDADTEGERPWMATEFVDGPNLRDAVLDHGPLPEGAVRVLAAALCEALAAIHAQGMVHRDLKPSNILLAADGPRVIDFGIVRALEATALTRTGTVVGSVGYVSPEQIRNNGQVGPPSDMFSLGAVLAYAAAGREPFGEGKDAVILMRIMTRDFDLSGVPEAVRQLVEPCLREDPGERPTPGEMISAVGHTARSLSASVGPGWFTAAGAAAAARSEAARGPAAEPAEGDQRWLPERDSGERESRVEYVAPVTLPNAAALPEAAPVTFPDVPAYAPDVPAAPSRRRLLRGLGAGALVAAGAGTGGWLWLRDRDGGDAGAGGTRGGAVGEGSEPAASAAATSPAVVTWQQATFGLGGKHGPCVGVAPDGIQVYIGGRTGKLYSGLLDGVGVLDTDVLGGPVLPPLVVGDRAYCLLDEGSTVDLCAVDSVVRGPQWRRRGIEKGCGVFPVAAGDLVLVTTGTSRDKGTVRAYRANGSVAWETRTPGTPTSEPMVADGVVYVGTFADVVAALDAKNGKLLWTAEAGTDPGRPELVGETLVVGCWDRQSVRGISVKGDVLWSAENEDVGVYTGGGGLGTHMPFTAFEGMALTTNNRQLVAVDPKDGSTAWTFRGDGEVRTAGAPAVYGLMAYVCLDETLYVVDWKGQEQRAVSLAGMEAGTTHWPVVHAQSPVYTKTLVYVGTPDGIVALDLSA
ncbi:protein kinase [Streptomyces sp. HC44]|uniref:Protein kinase n=1 Tax=Streptomyces scabichelini TaxID=2711217 RepID=A0A6G4VHK3_9ACTN|nr:serine/threonine-protein kinase [Streptomyces scabichelini]NGO13290.1 protein kinase [Streptomyces scabichelini]